LIHIYQCLNFDTIAILQRIA